MSKGSTTRPSSVPREIRDLRYQLIFGTESEKQEARKRLIELGVIHADTLENKK